jgi:glycosyltransferase involved in cell wall biosynthesis
MENGVPVFRDPILLPLRFAGPATMAWLSHGMLRRLRDRMAAWGSPDLIHAHVSLPGGWLASLIGRQWNVPVVLTEHAGPFSSLLRSQGQRNLVCQAISRAHVVIAVSPTLAEEMQSAFPETRVRVLGNVVRTDLFMPGDASMVGERSQKTVSTVALLTAGKGIDVLLEAVKLLRDRGHTGFQVLIGGDGPDRYRLEKVVKTTALQDVCRFGGMLRRDEVRNLLTRSDVFVLPSFGETFGVALGEAMACGKYVIATRCGGPEFVIEAGTGVLIDRGNPLQLADALEKALDGRDEAIGVRARDSIVRRFGPEAFLGNMASIYASLN